MGTRLEGKVAVIIGAGCVGPGWGMAEQRLFDLLKKVPMF